MPEDLLTLAADLRRRGEVFALATVVRCERPTSAKPGAKALIRPDGRVAGWVGGACAEPVVAREALAALRDGRPRLVVLVGEGGRDPARAEGIVPYPMTCHSGGTLEIYVEPFLPKALLVLVGHGPVIETLAILGESTGYEVAVLPGATAGEALRGLSLGPDSSVVVATHGELDEDALTRVLATAAGYVSLVASRKRAASITATLRQRGVPGEHLDRLKAPAGLDIGALTPEEIAVSILAEIIHARRSRKTDHLAAAAPEPAAAAEARDPICGMTVEVATARHRSDWAGRSVYFCCLRCKDIFDADPQRYAAAL
ncbi:MAG TPA: XdhC family protein [Candidatus Deferrimicrobiaceae bacterium]|nr:XdhC family protein [Candidatus Deferrimicrobiaceae bacterium]